MLKFNYNTRTFNNIQHKIVDVLRKQEDTIKLLSDQELTQKARELRENSSQISIDDLHIQGIGLACEASRRILKLDPYDVQIAGASLLCDRNIVEMQTGEGKTLVAMLSAFVQSMIYPHVHIATVNEYLVLRDYEQMQPVFALINTTCSFIVNSSTQEHRKQAYESNIIYATSTELGFDYLRDGLCLSIKDQVATGYHSIIVDEADSNMLDEAMTPLVISDAGTHNTDLIYVADRVVKTLSKEEVKVDFKDKTASIRDIGYQKIEKFLCNDNHIQNPEDLYSPSSQLLYHIHAAVRAYFLYEEGKDYILRDGKVEIISEKTGRVMSGRRWSEGLHQAIEAKEKVQLNPDSFTSATITLQHFYKMYKNLSGMTGTVTTDAIELKEIYNINIVVLPTNKPCIRIVHPDLIFITKASKYKAISNLVKKLHDKQQPVLIGTNSINDSETLSNILSSVGIKHQVLNAKYLKKEANIIAQAGVPGTVTVATNMAGRGTDIVLGGQVKHELHKNKDPKIVAKIFAKQQEQAEIAKKAGGLFVIGSERNTVRRIDNQLIGRCARQGDPGEAQFFVSLEDSLITHFTEKMNLNIEDDGQPINLPGISSLISKAQNRIMRNNFSGRKALAKDGDLIEQKRRIFSNARQKILSSDYSNEELKEVIQELFSITNLEQVKDIPEDKYRDFNLEKKVIISEMTSSWKEFVNLVSSEKKSISLKAQCEQRNPEYLLEKTINELFDSFLEEYRSKAISALRELWSFILKHKVKIEAQRPLDQE